MTKQQPELPEFVRDMEIVQSLNRMADALKDEMYPDESDSTESMPSS